MSLTWAWHPEAAQGYHQGSRQWHRIHTWMSGFITAWGINMDAVATQLLGASQTTVVTWGGPIQTLNLLLSLVFIIALNHGDPRAGQQAQGWVCACISSRLLYTYLAMTVCWSQPCLSPITTICSPGLLFCIAHALFHFSIFPTSPSCITVVAPASTWLSFTPHSQSSHPCRDNVLYVFATYTMVKWFKCSIKLELVSKLFIYKWHV